jgi:hypothetical protein
MVAGVAVATGLVLAIAVGPSAALASANLNWGKGVQAPLPSTAGTAADVETDAVFCPSTGNCAAVGRYRDGSGSSQGLLLSESSGKWKATEATLPAGADTSNPIASFNSVSCASAGNCTAVGAYRDTPNDYSQAMMVTETSGKWGPAVEATPPNVATASNPTVTLNSVSCTSPGDCIAVGDYIDTSGNTQGLVLTQSDGAWTPTEATLPSDAGSNPYMLLIRVSCASTGNCAAVGTYKDSSGNTQGLLLPETSGAWTAAGAILPSGHASNPFAVFDAVSCASAGNCTAGGYYTDTAGHDQAMLITEASSAWGHAVKAPLPSGAAAQPYATIESVSCASAGDCGAVGYYYDTSGNPQGVLLTETSGAWKNVVKAVLPAGAAAKQSVVSVDSVSCPSVGNCAAIGSYDDSSGGQGFVLTQTAGKWGGGVKLGLPGNAVADSKVVNGGLSCTSLSDCTAVARYSTVSTDEGAIFATSKASPRLAVSAPASGTVGKAIAGAAVGGTLTAGAAPIGTIQFRVFGPQPSPPSSCLTGGKTVGATTSVSGNHAYHPAAGFTPTAAGTYWWYAAYSGDRGDNAAASVCGASMAKTVVNPVPVLSSFAQTHARWREGTALPKIAAASSTPVGTVFSFTLNQAATVKLVFSQGGKPKGTLSLPAASGANKITFQGRLSTKHRLATGQFTVTITATNASQATSVPKKLSFTIVS